MAAHRSAMPRAGKSRQKSVRYAVIGLGHIAQAAVLPAFKHARRNSVLAALVSGEQKKLKALGRRYRVGRLCGYDEVDQLFASGEVDAVYIALPNDMHKEFTVRAARAGIHVLCEKPMAVTARECEQMIRAARQARVKLMIAYRLHFERANLEAAKLARTGTIGELRFFSSDFSMQVSEDNIRLERGKGGGPLYDIGIYCINAARYLFRAEPEEVFAFDASSKDKRFREVEESVSVVMRFPDAQLAGFACSFGAADVSAYEVVGTKGSLRADPAYEYAESLKLKITINGKVKERDFGKSDQFGPELVYFSDCILKNKDPEPSGKEGLADVRVIRALYESLDKREPVRVKIEEPEKRPSAVQEIRRPPIQKPDLIHAGSSSAD